MAGWSVVQLARTRRGQMPRAGALGQAVPHAQTWATSLAVTGTAGRKRHTATDAVSHGGTAEPTRGNTDMENDLISGQAQAGDVSSRKLAWRILHAEIRRQAAPDPGLETHPQWERIGGVLKLAHDADIPMSHIVIDLANLGATYALLSSLKSGSDVFSVAAEIERQIMAEPADGDDE